MFYSPLTKKALEKAAALHDGQYRKGPRRLPILTHLVSVAGIVAHHTDDAEVIAAALLHDSIEDTPYSQEEMHAEFGEKITEYVIGVTIPEVHNGINHEWMKDRRNYYKNLAEASAQSALIAAADKIDNFTSIVLDYAGKPEDFRAVFSGSPEDRAFVYQAIVDMLTPRVPKELARELNTAWEECLHKVVRA